MATRTQVESLIGRALGHFRIDALLGQGGMGAVYRAWDLSLERSVALKTVLLDSPHTRALFMREARAQAKLHHPNVVPVHYVGEDEGITYLVMELVNGESLAALLEREKRVTERRALDIIDAVAAALESAHAEGLIHRDIKPSNVLVAKSGRILLADFGLAKATGAAASDSAETSGDSNGPVAHTKGAIGTPAYMAPEVTAGAGVVDHRADIYSLGVTWYELVTGTLPFGGATNSRLASLHEHAPVIEPRVIVSDLSEETQDLILRMLVKQPGGRLPDYATLRRAIAGINARRFPAPLLPRVSALALDVLPFALLDAALTHFFPHGNHRAFVWLPALFVFSWFESRRGATWGKQLVGIHIVTEVGERLSLGAAIVRSSLKCHVVMVMAMTYSFMSLYPHDTPARIRAYDFTFKLMAGMMLVMWVPTMFFVLGKRREAFHDRLVKSRVVVNVRPEE